MFSLTIKNDVSELAALEPFVEEISEAFGLDMTLAFSLQLALDEALTNVVSYAYSEATGMPVTVNAEVEEDGGQRRLVIDIIDHGMPFNPIEEAPEVDTTVGAEQRQIGGLGIFLIRKTMDELRYRRDEGTNVFTLIKNIG